MNVATGTSLVIVVAEDRRPITSRGGARNLDKREGTMTTETEAPPTTMPVLAAPAVRGRALPHEEGLITGILGAATIEIGRASCRERV